jgi:hypothetical protein
MAKRRRDGGYESRGARTIETLRHYAVAGAQAALAKLREEIQIIERTFPELSSAQGRKHVVATTEKRARSMSTAARKAVSARMKKYWAERRKQAAKTKK